MGALPAAQSTAAGRSRRLERISHLLERGLEDARDLYLREPDLGADAGFTQVSVVAKGDDPPLTLGERPEARAEQHAILAALESDSTLRRLERDVVERHGER